MRERRLSRQEALEEYLAYKIRLFQYLHMFQVALQIKDGEYKPENALGHRPDHFLDTVRSASYGLFASLMDPQKHALDVFDVWRVLFPDQEKNIIETWEKIKPHVQLIKDYRNDVAFHANKDLGRYFETRRRFREKGKEIVAAMQAFLGLAAELVRQEATQLPDLRGEIDPILKRALPDIGTEVLEAIKDSRNFGPQHEPSRQDCFRIPSRKPEWTRTH